TQAAHELRQLMRCTRPLDAAADVKQRLLALFDRLDSAFDLARVALDGGLETANIDLVRVVIRIFRLLDVLGDIDDNRARTSSARDIKGLFNNAREVFHVFDEVVVLAAGA